MERKGQGTPAEHVAVLCTDISEGTKSVDSGDDLDQLQATYDEVIFTQALRRNGFMRYNLGDMYLVTFRSASDALKAATSILWNLEQSRHEPFQLGLDFGSVRSIRGRLYGSVLSRVAPAPAHQRAVRSARHVGSWISGSVRIHRGRRRGRSGDNLEVWVNGIF